MPLGTFIEYLRSTEERSKFHCMFKIALNVTNGPISINQKTILALTGVNKRLKLLIPAGPCSGRSKPSGNWETRSPTFRLASLCKTKNCGSSVPTGLGFDVKKRGGGGGEEGQPGPLFSVHHCPEP